MKTKLLFLSILFLILCACSKNSDSSESSLPADKTVGEWKYVGIYTNGSYHSNALATCYDRFFSFDLNGQYINTQKNCNAPTTIDKGIYTKTTIVNQYSLLKDGNTTPTLVNLTFSENNTKMTFYYVNGLSGLNDGTVWIKQ